MKNAFRYRALIFAILPFLIVGFLLLMNEALDSGGYLLVFAVSIPLLTAMSLLSAILAFSDKDPERKLIRTTKVLSIISMAVFGAICLVALYTMMVSL
jgi:hypothetical protein